jgi:hypothetical protein
MRRAITLYSILAVNIREIPAYGGKNQPLAWQISSRSMKSGLTNLASVPKIN